MAALVGVNVTDTILPYDTNDIYETHQDIYGKGGFRVVEDIAERDSIKFRRQSVGMLVYTRADGKTWRLLSANTILIPANWQEVVSGGTATTFVQPFTAQTVVNVNHNLGKEPHVMILDNSKFLMQGTVQHIDNNNLTVTFLTAETGTIHCI